MSTRRVAVDSHTKPSATSSSTSSTGRKPNESERAHARPDHSVKPRANNGTIVENSKPRADGSVLRLEQDADKLLQIIREQSRRKMLPKGEHMSTWAFNNWASAQPLLRQFWNEAPKLYETHRHLNAALGYDKLIALADHYNKDLYILCRSELRYSNSDKKWAMTDPAKKPLSFYFAGTRQTDTALEQALLFREAELKGMFNKPGNEIFVAPKGPSRVITEDSMRGKYWQEHAGRIPAQWMKLSTFVAAYQRYSPSKNAYQFIAKYQTIQAHSEGWCNFELLTKDTKWLITRSVFTPWIRAVVDELNSIGLYGVVERVMLLNNNVPADDFTDSTIAEKKLKAAVEAKGGKFTPPRPKHDVVWQLGTIINAFEASKGPCKKIKFVICAPKSGYRNGEADRLEWVEIQKHPRLLSHIIGADWVGPEYRENDKGGIDFTLKPDDFPEWEKVHPAIRQIAEKDGKSGQRAWALHAGELSYERARLLKPENTTLWGFLSNPTYQPRVVAHGLQVHWQKGKLLAMAQKLQPLFETTPTSNELLNIIPDFDACPQIFMMREHKLKVSVSCDNCTQCAITVSDELWKMSLGRFRDLTRTYEPMVCSIWDIKQMILSSALAMRQSTAEQNADMAKFNQAWEQWLTKWVNVLSQKYKVSSS